MVPKAFRVSAISGVPALGEVVLHNGMILEAELPPGSFPVPTTPGGPLPTCPPGYLPMPVQAPTGVYAACVPKIAIDEEPGAAQERNKMLIVGGVVFVAVAGIAIYFATRKGRR